MTELDIQCLLPLIILAGGILLIMLMVSVRRNHAVTFISALVVLVASFISVLFIRQQVPHTIGELFLIDSFGLYFQALILLATIVVTIFSYISIRNFFTEKRNEEYYLLLLLATLGVVAMVISTHFISFFVSLELLSVSLYTLISYYRERTKSIEAGLKYLMLAAMSSSFLLFGMALMYAVSGTMYFHDFATMAEVLSISSTTILIAGIGMMAVGIGFKLAVVPFHMWTPDIYEGASSPVSAFIATVSKGAMVAVLLRFFIMADLYRFENILLVFTIISILSMLIGNLLALMQNNVKRMLAYSSIAHFGYLLVAVIVGKEMGLEAATFYITAYMIMILGTFGLITIISQTDIEASDRNQYQGLFWRKPFYALIFSILLLSLAGIPLTAGFMGKFFVLKVGVGYANWLLVCTLVLSSVIGLYYYLRFIVTMMKQNDEAISVVNLSFASTIAGTSVLTVLGIMVLVLGIYPAWLVEIIHTIF